MAGLSEEQLRNRNLFNAAKIGKLDEVQALIDAGGEVDGHRDSDEWTAFIWCAAKGLTDMCKYLVAKGANPNAVNKGGANALHRAVVNSKVETVKVLPGLGVDINHMSGGVTALTEAVKTKNTEIILFLIENGADINLVGEGGWCALHEAVSKEAFDIVKLLVERGADVNNAQNNGWSPVHRALQNEDVEIVEFLLKHSADVSIHPKSGNTSLMWAAKSGKLELVSAVLNQGVDINEISQDGGNALTAALECRIPESVGAMVSFLLEKGADASAVVQGSSPLITACQYGHLDAAKALVEAGADVNFKDAEGYTPLFLAAAMGNFDVVKYLVSKNADHTVAVDGKTAAEFSKERGNDEIAAYLEGLSS